ncbi:MAG: tripartite tricarboxylate transporter permease [Peptococcaceae bacterium]
MDTLMNIILSLGNGLIEILNPITIALIIIGLLIGLLTSALPGLTLIIGVVLALPFTYSMNPTNAIVLLTAIYLAGTYGGAFPAILYKIPGDPIHVPLLWDGYPMTCQGRGAEALGWTLYANLFGGIFAAILMVLVSEPLAKIALSFSSPEYFAIVFFGLSSVLVLGTTSFRDAVVSMCIGLFIATVGVDAMFGINRFTFDTKFLLAGVDWLIVLVGIYAVAEIFSRLETGFQSSGLKTKDKAKIETALPKLKDCQKKTPTFLRGSFLGTIIGFIPGAGATVAAFISYGLEKQYGGKEKSKLGKGAPEGLISSQSAATASVGGALIPMLTLGIPGSGATAIILGAFMLHGIQPGPGIFHTNGNMIYAIYASVFVGILLTSILGLLAVKPIVKILKAPETIISAFIMVLCIIGAFALRNNIYDVWLLFLFGIIGFFLHKFQYPLSPLLLGTILGQIAERNFLTTMISYKNDWTIFFLRPISGALIIISIISIVVALTLPLWQKRKTGKITPSQ